MLALAARGGGALAPGIPAPAEDIQEQRNTRRNHKTNAQPAEALIGDAGAKGEQNPDEE